MGHSGHAYMALEYSKKYAAHVSHVVMIGIAPNLSAASRNAAERYWHESVSPERKAVFQANLQRLPDDALARLPAATWARQTRLRNAPKIWFDPHFDETPQWEGVEGNEVIIALEPTPYSFRSFLASAFGRGSPRALCGIRRHLVLQW
jgi:proline iminopeptidase